MSKTQLIDFTQLAFDIKHWGQSLGFQQVGITDIDLTTAEERLQVWLAKGFHGSMTYMAKHGSKRTRPAELLPGTIRIISVRMDYLPADAKMAATLKDKTKAYVSRYAVGRDYHKLIRKRLLQFAKKIETAVGHFGYRAFADSAPVMEKPIAEKAGLGWMGKHTLILNRQAGSWFFLGELYTDLPLPIDQPISNHCGSCTACLDICPTQAFVGPYQLDARRCISYLTIENKAAIPEALRSKMGNRVFGCDDCQLICPWNRFAKPTQEKDFQPRHGLTDIQLTEIFAWREEEYLRKTEGSALRRIGYEGWLRNIAVALGNAPSSAEIIAALKSRLDYPSELVREHVTWALKQHHAV
jgi:epoxyqueuosine reductase